MPGRVLALDVGQRRVGVAVSDETGLIAQPLPPLVRAPALEDDVRAIAALADRWQAAEIVVGWPVNLNGSVGPQAEAVRPLAEALQRVRPVRLWDERLSTRGAERLLIAQNVRRERRRQLIDGMAAVWILQGYLDHRHQFETGVTGMADDKDLFNPGEGEAEQEDEVIVLTDEDGHEHEFVVVDVIEVESREYAILLPIDAPEEEEAEAVILRLEKDADGDDILVDIDDEAEWEKVAQVYENMLDEEEE
ncbi:pre-16S ribosomal RNA maturation enzyme (modular protein) [Candidatus Hydrogenisulfobacillus filiaventi]|uniref:Multifunctional fusion protein n=1 Tax=Candidatus Hydrogenisulfobacillus filiaventi TaxID=2707344 RepID=A0A6F8ZG36_9FIRM|nr:Holliday junction resolvase RuvX [Bacillota bacterium]CAB1128953.1 pre-16S ribosomal RNA maturation enzyme (modular protein) [Candidatus Hydrogenisulfobacillus filiaventi]